MSHALQRGCRDPVFMGCCLLLLLPATLFAQSAPDHSGHAGHRMGVTAAGVVMNENHDILPRDCTTIRRDYAFTVRAGRAFARGHPGQVFGFDQYELVVEPCSRLEITFVNEDDVRHQWMVHGLPKYLYPAGMFHLEAAGGHQVTGTFIVPGDDRTYLVHCDMAQHMEKGMRAQLLVGRGSGDLWGVTGVSDQFRRADYLPSRIRAVLLLVLGLSCLLALWRIGLR